MATLLQVHYAVKSHVHKCGISYGIRLLNMVTFQI